jgi:hypothetical protein
MRRAKEAWDNGDLTQLAELLDRHRPGDGEADRRGFEWHWLRRCLGARAGTLKAHDGGLLCAAVSPDGRFLVTGDKQGAVKVWDLASFKQVGSLPGHTTEVKRAVFSRDGRTLATCSSVPDGTVRLWEVATWRQAGCLRGHDGSVTSVAFSPDGTRLASAGHDHRIVLWELPRGRAVRSWAAHPDWGPSRPIRRARPRCCCGVPSRRGREDPRSGPSGGCGTGPGRPRSQGHAITSQPVPQRQHRLRGARSTSRGDAGREGRGQRTGWRFSDSGPAGLPGLEPCQESSYPQDSARQRIAPGAKNSSISRAQSARKLRLLR